MAAAVGKNLTFSRFTERAGQLGRQETPVDVTPAKKLPSKRASRLLRCPVTVVKVEVTSPHLAAGAADD